MWRDDRRWPTPKRTVRRELVEVDFLMPSTATDQIYGPDTQGPHGSGLSGQTSTEWQCRKSNKSRAH